jgi:Domain of unknown function (DUF4293)
MIQRIQSLWLLLAASLVFLTVKLPFYSGTNAKAIPSYELNAGENILLLSTTIITALFTVFIIFLYKKRKLQLGLCIVGILLDVLLIFLYKREIKTFTLGTYSLWSIFHSLIVICFFLAARAINKDEKLVKDSDRLR